MESSAAPRTWIIAILFLALLATAGPRFIVKSGVSNARGGGEPAAASDHAAAEPIRYGRDIRPILSDRCFTCHGQDSAQRKADLRLDLREGLLASRPDGPVVVPGDPERSELWRRVTSHDPDEQMPPPSANRRSLSEREQGLLHRWIAQGAPYEPHWAFVAPVRGSLPPVRDAQWCRNDVDRFILARLEREGVTPSPEADRATLLRRVFLDLTGLPPTPEEIDEFHLDRRSDAYERLVDRLLTAEPYRTRYAERMAGPWLDAARYADTNGIHTDAGRQIWPWRDWVLSALRDNMRFDRFLTEQVAGDLIPDATRDQKIASGFNRNHVMTDEGGAIPEEYIVEYAVDRAATTGSVFLGLTLGCARCHDHKYDPVSHEDFYGFYAFFNSVDEPGLYSQLPDSNRAFEPFIAVPSPEQERVLAGLRERLSAAKMELDAPDPQEDAARSAFLDGLPARAGIAWAPAQVVKAAGAATFAVQHDGSVLASGANPENDEHVITLRTDATGLRLISLEAIPDPSLPHGRIGRSENGNAVLTGVEVQAVSVADPDRRVNVPLAWAWADHEQEDGDHRIVNVLDTSDDLGWAVDAHRRTDGRAAMLLAAEPFGFHGGTEVIVRLQYNSIYPRHALGRVRLALGSIGEHGLEFLPVSSSGWYLVGPFPADSGQAAFETAFGPELEASIDLARNFGSGNQYWRYDQGLRDGRLNNFGDGTNATYVGRRIFSPTARSIDLSLGSDDGFRLFINTAEAASNRIDRSLAADQDRASLQLNRGVNTLVFKVVNTGGPAGFYFRVLPRPDELSGELASGLLPGFAMTPGLRSRFDHAWKLAFSRTYRASRERIAGLERELASTESQVPLTMVMKELPTPRDTYVLTRGAYDQPDLDRPVRRAVPASLGKLADDMPSDRLGLSRWMTSDDNPLVARVAVNRFWEMLFGTGIVATSEDFGMQGEWPSHPELLDWLAVEFRESGWDVRHVFRILVTSSTYRQSSRLRPDQRERDPDNRLLSSFPRRRLTAEQIRDQALYVSGLLVERLGGPSVKPYQPDGLWQEVAMPVSNTRNYTRGKDSDLWRRSLYTYWKRACPPPSLMTLDAPTREFCTIRRIATNTPLQALALWNDEQFVEAARVLAQRTLAEPISDGDRLSRMFLRCSGRDPGGDELSLLMQSLAAFRERYSTAPQDAASLLKIGESPLPPGIDQSELAAWTMVANAILNLSATITQD
ncbi:MAG: PSD1 domain-containing protein [Phycisphaeraceae bacterium]|nr:PSD1 domain-containing protein [Phycisphaerae bacterium]MBX3391764.1 PSD1 domain-containing protein [Phycisphaeraceae bacterium]